MFAKCVELSRFPLSDSRMESISFTLVNIIFIIGTEVTIITTLVIMMYGEKSQPCSNT